MNIELEITGLAKITGLVKGFSDMFLEKLPGVLNRLGFEATALMKDRVVNFGRDIHGDKFKPYADRTMAAMKAKGHAKKSKDDVNLFDTGQMMGMVLPSMKSPSECLIFVAGGPAVYGLQHQMGSGKLPQREWFGLTEKERDFISQKFKRDLSKEFEALK